MMRVEAPMAGSRSRRSVDAHYRPCATGCRVRTAGNVQLREDRNDATRHFD